jgi:hypothetical protein
MARLPAILAVLVTFLTAACATTGSSKGPSQERTLEEARRSATAQAATCFEAFFEGELAAFVDCNPEALVETMGGREQMIAFVAHARGEMESQGFSFDSIDINEPVEIVEAGEDLYAIILVTLRMGSPVGVLQSDSFMVGMSRDKGVSWVFLDGAGLNPETVRAFMPTFPEGVELPEKGIPRLVQ